MSVRQKSLLYPSLQWSEYCLILSFLSITDVYKSIGRACRDGFVTFLREKSARASKLQLLTRFLPRDIACNKVLLVSYPRSGNSFLRKLIEHYTGITTGSDSRTNRVLTSALLACGFYGEGITDSSVLVVKSHYPERMGYSKFGVKKVILLVRNPFDALESYFHMGMTDTHNKNLTNEAFLSLHLIWQEFIKNEAQIWNKFHEYWLEKAKEISVSMLVIRYEDLVLHKAATMDRILHFLHGNEPQSPLLEHIRNSHLQQMASLASEEVHGPGYNPNKNGYIGKSLQLFSSEQKNILLSSAQKTMSDLGYTVNTDNKLDLIESKYPNYVNEVRDVVGMKVNEVISIREQNDQFGRNFSDFRNSLLANGTALTTRE